MNIHQLIAQSKQNTDLITVEATVITGFEFLAQDECRDKCKPVSLSKSKGRIFLNIFSPDFKKVLGLRSVDNILLVAQTFENIPFEGKKDCDLQIVKSLVDKIDWDNILKKWIEITSFQGIVYPLLNKTLYTDAESVIASLNQGESNEVPKSGNFEVENNFNSIELVGNSVIEESSDHEYERISQKHLLSEKSNCQNVESTENIVQLKENSCTPAQTDLISSDSITEINSSHCLSNPPDIIECENKDEHKVENADNSDNNNDISERFTAEEGKEKNSAQSQPEQNFRAIENVKGGPDKVDDILPLVNKKGNRANTYGKSKLCEQRKSGKRRGQKSVERLKSSNPGDILRFRVTCNRVGEKHSFNSMEAACEFGGTLQDKFGWTVDLTQFDLNVVLNIENKHGYVCVAITHESLHRRNITHFSNTTLRATMCYNLFRLAEPMTGEIVIDPLCGGGSIPIEGALSFPNTFHVCGDYNGKAIDRTRANIDHVNNNEEQLKIGAVAWNVKHLPLRDQSIDILITDLPFGKRSGSKQDNQRLYNKVLLELARVIRTKTGRACLMTYDKTSLVRALRKQNEYWREIRQFGVNQGGLFSSVFLLLRKATDFTESNSEMLMEDKQCLSSCESDDKITEENVCDQTKM